MVNGKLKAAMLSTILRKETALLIDSFHEISNAV